MLPLCSYCTVVGLLYRFSLHLVPRDCCTHHTWGAPTDSVYSRHTGMYQNPIFGCTLDISAFPCYILVIHILKIRLCNDKNGKLKVTKPETTVIRDQSIHQLNFIITNQNFRQIKSDDFHYFKIYEIHISQWLTEKTPTTIFQTHPSNFLLG